MDYFYRISLLFAICALCYLQSAHSQTLSDSYHLNFTPDLWYNDVDGIRVGFILQGRVEGTHEEGPHRLNLGAWLGTWFPDLPVSYHLTYTEPIDRYSSYGSEANVRLTSSIREGYHLHGVGINKRWQEPFDFRNYKEAGIGFNLEQRFDREYTSFPQRWNEEWKGMLQARFIHQKINSVGRFYLSTHAEVNLLNDNFTTGRISVTQQFGTGSRFGFWIRGFAGLASENTYPEYLFLRSTGPAISSLSNPLTRSKGTIPEPWLRSGQLHTAGGANLRGYTDQDIRWLKSGIDQHLTSMASVNVELDLPNPVTGWIRNNDPFSEFVSFRSYLFGDAGGEILESGHDPGKIYAGAGAGLALSINIPDYLGKPRGFVLRYEIPFWLNRPLNEDEFKYRHLFGIGAVISF